MPVDSGPIDPEPDGTELRNGEGDLAGVPSQYEDPLALPSRPVVFHRDEDDDVPDPRYVHEPLCESGVALQAMQGTPEVSGVTATDDWGAVVAALGELGNELSTEMSTSVSVRAVGRPGRQWTAVDSDGAIVAIVTTYDSHGPGDDWNALSPALCVSIG